MNGRWSILTTLALTLVLGSPGAARARSDEDGDEEQDESARYRELAQERYFDKCQVPADKDEIRRVEADWEILLRIGYEPAELFKIAARLPDDCDYVSFRSAIQSTAPPSSGGRSDRDDRDDRDDEPRGGGYPYRAHRNAVVATGVSTGVLAGISAGYNIAKALVIMGQWNADNVKDPYKVITWRSKNRHLVVGAVSALKFVPIVISASYVNRDEIPRSSVVPHFVLGVMDLGIAGLCIAGAHEWDVRGFETNLAGAWMWDSVVMFKLFAVFSTVAGVAEIVLATLSLDVMVTGSDSRASRSRPA